MKKTVTVLICDWQNCGQEGTNKYELSFSHARGKRHPTLVNDLCPEHGGQLMDTYIMLKKHARGAVQ